MYFDDILTLIEKVATTANGYTTTTLYDAILAFLTNIMLPLLLFFLYIYDKKSNNLNYLEQRYKNQIDSLTKKVKDDEYMYKREIEYLNKELLGFTYMREKLEKEVSL